MQRLFTKRKTRREKKELAEAMEMWRLAGLDLESARRSFNSARNSFETESAIHEMCSAEAKRSHALCKIRNITMAQTVAEKFSASKEK